MLCGSNVGEKVERSRMKKWNMIGLGVLHALTLFTPFLSGALTTRRLSRRSALGISDTVRSGLVSRAFRAMPNANLLMSALDSPTVTDEEVTLPRSATQAEPSTGVGASLRLTCPRCFLAREGRLVKLLLVDSLARILSTWHAPLGQPVDTAALAHSKGSTTLSPASNRVAICCALGHRGQERVFGLQGQPA